MDGLRKVKTLLEKSFIIAAVSTRVTGVGSSSAEYPGALFSGPPLNDAEPDDVQHDQWPSLVAFVLFIGCAKTPLEWLALAHLVKKL